MGLFSKWIDMGVRNELLQRDKRQLEDDLREAENAASHERRRRAEVESNQRYEIAMARVRERLQMWHELNPDKRVHSIKLPLSVHTDIQSYRRTTIIPNPIWDTLRIVDSTTSDLIWTEIYDGVTIQIVGDDNDN